MFLTIGIVATLFRRRLLRHDQKWSSGVSWWMTTSLGNRICLSCPFVCAISKFRANLDWQQTKLFEMTGDSSTTKRSFASHTPKWQRFQSTVNQISNKASDSTTHVYRRQYSHVYAQRLVMLKNRCWKLVPDGLHRINRVLDLREDVKCVLVGTLVKESSGSGKPLGDDTRCREGDAMALEDESGRVSLALENVHDYSSGMVVAVEGSVKEGGVMHVTNIYLPSTAPHPKLQGELRDSSNSHSPCVLLLSGLDCGNPAASTMKRDMLLAYLEGHMTSSASRVCRVVVAGDSIHKDNMTYGTKELDGFLAQICAAGIPIDLLPGKDDPTTANWPQRPIHSALLPFSSTFRNQLLTRTPNPYAAGLGNKYVLGTDGRNVLDLQKSLWKEDKPYSELETLERIVECGHLCPTGPDSVPTVPHTETDPMVIQQTPHILFSGNCRKFSTGVVKHSNGAARLVCIPKFADSGEAVLVHLSSMDCELLRFDDSM